MILKENGALQYLSSSELDSEVRYLCENRTAETTWSSAS